MAEPETKNKPKIAPKIKLKEPSQYRVIYINDEVTTMEFVVETLKIMFYYDESAAVAITEKIHEAGSAVVAVLPYEIAEQKAHEANTISRHSGFPLTFSVEEE